MNPNLLLVGGLCLMAAAASVGVVAFRSAVRSAISLVINFFTLAFLYFALSAELVGATQIVVYAGAIMVLFLFVIMLLNLGGPRATIEEKDPRVPIGIALGLGFFAVLASQIIAPIQRVLEPVSDNAYGSPENVGRTLFSLYVYPFEMVSLLLLVGIVGSILLAKRRI